MLSRCILDRNDDHSTATALIERNDYSGKRYDRKQRIGGESIRVAVDCFSLRYFVTLRHTKQHTSLWLPPPMDDWEVSILPYY
jgi:hypothetical protein